METYNVFYIYRNPYNVQSTYFRAKRFLSTSEALKLAKDAVSRVYNRKDTITAITCADGAYVNMGNENFAYFGD